MKYGQLFFDYVDEGAAQSAQAIAETLFPVLHPNSVLDVGCGRGGWLRAWKAAGAREILGIDGDYVDLSKLAVARQEFQPVDLAHPFDLGRKFDFVQSLEVGEHLPPAASKGFVESITRHGDIVLFSAALPGQGGTQHINERPIQHWRSPLRPERLPRLRLPAARHPGRARKSSPGIASTPCSTPTAPAKPGCPPEILATAVPDRASVRNFTTPSWMVRRALVRYLPVRIVDQLAVINAKLRLMQRQTGQP